MTLSSPRIVAASAILALAVAASTAGCRAAGPDVDAAGASASTEQGLAPGGGTATDRASASGDVSGPARTEPEKEFLDQLAAFGVPTDMTAETNVEVGLGICRGIADGADTETILDRIRPLSSAIAAHDPTRDTAQVGRAIIDASRAHLCG